MGVTTDMQPEPPTQDHTNSQLAGRSLTIARVFWVLFALILTSLHIVSQAAAFHRAQGILLTPSQMQRLAAMGLSVEAYARINFLMELPIPIVWGCMGLLIFLLKSKERNAIILSAVMVGSGMATSVPAWMAFTAEYPRWAWLVILAAFIGNLCLFSFFFVFPTGRYVPRWTVVLPWILSASNILLSYDFVLPATALAWGENLTWFFPVFGITALVSIMLAPLYRYRRASTQVERAQVKWVVFAITVGMLIFFITAITALQPGFIPGEDINFITVFFQPVGWSSPFILIALAIAFSILRYRLLDIDLIIRRTLQYSILTGLLALIYFGIVIFLQNTLFRSQRSEIIIVLSTLAIAALFNPLRLRVQAFINRRFFRKKYNAEQALAKFATAARDEVDMEKLNTALLDVVVETMQPAHVSLWIVANLPEVNPEP